MSDPFADFFGVSPNHSIGTIVKGLDPKGKSRSNELDDAGRTPYQRYEIHRANKEESEAERSTQLARQAKVKADLDELAVVNREAVRTSAARAFAKCSQAFDSIGDLLERDGVPQDVCEKVMLYINAAKSQLSADLQKTFETSDDKS